MRSGRKWRGVSLASSGSIIVLGADPLCGEAGFTGPERQSAKCQDLALLSAPVGAVAAGRQPVGGDGRRWLPHRICACNGTAVARPTVAIAEGQSRIQKKTAFQVKLQTLGEARPPLRDSLNWLRDCSLGTAVSGDTVVAV